MADVAGVTMDEVLRVAELANLNLTAEEVPRMQRDLNAILGHIAQLNELDTAGVPAMAQVGEMLGAEVKTTGASLRADAVRPSLRPRGGDGLGAGERWPLLQGAKGD